jgi:hypothetical protein
LSDTRRFAGFRATGLRHLFSVSPDAGDTTLIAPSCRVPSDPRTGVPQSIMPRQSPRYHSKVPVWRHGPQIYQPTLGAERMIKVGMPMSNVIKTLIDAGHRGLSFDDDAEPFVEQAIAAAGRTSHYFAGVQSRHFRCVLKNGLEWASRRNALNDAWQGCLDDDSLSGLHRRGEGTGSAARNTVDALSRRCLARIVFTSVHEKIVDGRLVDQSSLRFALAGIDDLVSKICVWRAEKMNGMPAYCGAKSTADPNESGRFHPLTDIRHRA